MSCFTWAIKAGTSSKPRLCAGLYQAARRWTRIRHGTTGIPFPRRTCSHQSRRVHGRQTTEPVGFPPNAAALGFGYSLLLLTTTPFGVGDRWTSTVQLLGDNHWVSVVRGPPDAVVDAWGVRSYAKPLRAQPQRTSFAVRRLCDSIALCAQEFTATLQRPDLADAELEVSLRAACVLAMSGTSALVLLSEVPIFSVTCRVTLQRRSWRFNCSV